MKKLVRLGIYIPVILAIVHSIVDLHGTTLFWGTVVLRDILVYAYGLQMLCFAVGHLLFGNAVAEYIGWPKDDPFQFEVGLADLGMGAVGYMCNWFGGYFWLAPIVMGTVFGWGCAIGHIKHMVKNKNFNPGNAGFALWWDIFLPVALIVLGIIHFTH